MVFGGVDAVVKIGLYIAHEWAWAKITIIKLWRFL